LEIPRLIEGTPFSRPKMRRLAKPETTSATSPSSTWLPSGFFLTTVRASPSGETNWPSPRTVTSRLSESVSEPAAKFWLLRAITALISPSVRSY
jgi:hypothetical protein